MCAIFLFFLGTYGALHDSHQRKDLINKAVLGAPVYFYFAIYLIFANRTNSPSVETLTRWQWIRRHWLVCVGCVAFELVVLAGWVIYLRHHGFTHVS
jgi:hypothetical protein